ncbi:hypothetical protein QE364_002365 [Nocardioides zeae]|uniref:Uncharacterized protein n=1 Tax=Nocardioides zeae TaxID=1457234 RepID=A0ACC6IIR3_9ACTN|nr:hypothetical protein [Nocardioides zeae]MDR6174579.1 hypothetical protein [Nocardioides zeae]MDR6210650.1 hypothetical protein [Nocardioides zeae]
MADAPTVAADAQPVGQGWSLLGAPRDHCVITDPTAEDKVTWFVDGEIAATCKDGGSDTAVLTPEDRGLGALAVRRSYFGDATRVTWYPPTEDGRRLGPRAAAHLGRGGIDLVPDAGSPAAVREEEARRHPVRTGARHVVSGAAKVVLPIAGVWVMLQLVGLLGHIPLPDLPSVPWPDLPSISWPDLPRVPWPDLPDLPTWHEPEWVRRAARVAPYVLPVVVGLAVAWAEHRRRRAQDRRRAAASESTETVA